MMTGTFESVQHPLYALDSWHSQLLSKILSLPMEAAHELKLEKMDRRSMIKDLLTFYSLHIDKLPEIQTHRILAEVLEG